MSIVYEQIDDFHVRTYSDERFYIKDAAGSLYVDAIDNIDVRREYTESDIEIIEQEATIDDYIDALRAIGVNTDEKE